MSLNQAQLVKWSLPAFALILGLLWYKRRRVDRVDPGGSSKLKADTGNTTPQSKSKSSLCDSGIHTDDSFNLNNSASTPAEEIISPRKVSESLDIPNRKNSSQSMSLLSGLQNTPWYDEVEDPTPEMREMGSKPKGSLDFMNKKSSQDMKSNSKGSSIMSDTIQEEQVKVVVASKTETSSGQNGFGSGEKTTITDHTDDKKQNQALSERDSANHSPVSGMLEGSVADEARSEGSTDSGKGGSIKGHSKDVNRALYEFTVPAKLVGKLIGRSGRFLAQIRSHAGVSIVVKRHPLDRDAKMCSIEGSVDGISAALEIIRQHFPEKQYPTMTLEQLTYEQIIPEEIPWMPEVMLLSLVEGVNNDVIVSHIIKPNHLFIQLPTHPTYPSLRILDERITQLYDTVESPPVPDQLSKGMIFVAKWYNRWVRVFVENPDPAGEQNLVRLVDHGGYCLFSNAEMRKIRSDYLTLPFQAIEVFLANVQPVGGEWSPEACSVVAQICTNIVGQAQIVGYSDSSTYINLYFNIHKHGVISVADELIARGFAEPITLEEVVPQEVQTSV
ncbi:hypothetical protein QAD02_010712 [Eretmocerus hayati]|uniref:Uncharacterized protein n=1 Tax=Eretmocerus hayati TaxID=131215 RepID=A0ACC2NVU6_9HYME|nr:hypothetical protein QAD02_010712 [Eretmocerus hayati]